jgi:hypothetical protein
MTTTKTRTPRRTTPADSGRETLLTDFALIPISDADRRRAALAVCDRSIDAAEARTLLEALGLLDPEMLRGAA